jgi:exopolysaccharide production protein ExoQ
MPPYLALFLWGVLLIALWRLDPARSRGASFALWIPLAALFIAGSRLPSQWLGLLGTTSSMQAFEEGNALDRAVHIVLLLLSTAVLVSRSFHWGAFIRRNAALSGFLAFALLSVIWSDYPFVGFKRWIRDLTYYFAILVVVSDPQPLDAIRLLFRRTCFLLIPLSIVFVKYFPDMGRQYDIWTGRAGYVGVTLSKNMLGALCLFSMMVFVWDILVSWRDRNDPSTRRRILIDAAFVWMTFWLLKMAGSATSTLCLVLGCLALVAMHRTKKPRPVFLRTAMVASFPLIAILWFGAGVDIGGTVAAAVGRDSTLTDRTLIWETLLGFDTNPFLGVGYESFWMGPRLQAMWAKHGTINEAHNGYLQTYLNLGIIGLCFLTAFIITTYRRIWQQFGAKSAMAPFGAGVWTALLFYNLSEAALPGGLLWWSILPVALYRPPAAERATDPVTTASRGTVPDVRRHAWRPPADGKRRTSFHAATLRPRPR